MNGARKKNQPKVGAAPPRKGPVPDISTGGPNYNRDLGPTQPKDRSLGMRRVKGYPQNRGL